MKEIKLTQGKVTLVDDEDYEVLKQWKWYAMKQPNGIFYAVRNVYLGNGKARGLRMHRFILGLTEFKDKCDHIDHDGLNNQRSNLRIATNAENAFNTRSHTNAASKFLGVSWFSRDSNWRVQICVEGKNKHVGYYKTEIEAALAYNEAAKELHGEFANLNRIAV